MKVTALWLNHKDSKDQSVLLILRLLLYYTLADFSTIAPELCFFFITKGSFSHYYILWRFYFVDQ